MIPWIIAAFAIIVALTVVLFTANRRKSSKGLMGNIHTTMHLGEIVSRQKELQNHKPKSQ
ncbi:hypothetical protein [Priestia koreensis]|uniref:Uncharacterized protein n=1 Tax=Priestia koreensis TaxID=284581 RepID=A0A0M0LI04_9BACI|nr:hypothetical protein [Priestia koreensis]KOO50522.1 hypothetical protein AMD01_01875 [Priestia koreensis]